MNQTTNLDYHEILKQKPFGWEFNLGPGVNHYKFEEIDHLYWKSLFEENWKFVYYVSAVYLVSITLLQIWMKNKPPFKLKGPLFVWNMGIGIFSILGFFRTAPSLMRMVVTEGFYNSICLKKGAEPQLPFWGLAFVLSKYLELIDTLFLVLRKKPVIFLQWYHHMITMIGCWLIAPAVEPIVRWFGFLNYGVHSLMYPYFAVRAIGIKTPVFIPNFITTIQFAQMLAGGFINVLTIYYYLAGYDCFRDPFSVKMCSVVVASFLWIFGKLFYQSVVQKGRIQKEKSRMKVE